MPLPNGYTLLPGPPTAPPPNGMNYAPGLDGKWYSFPSPGQDNSVLNTATATPGYSPSPSFAPQTGLLGVIGDIDKEFPLLGKLDDAFNLNPNTSGSLTATNGPIASVGTLLSIVTDLPRMATMIIGLVLLIIGLAMLGSGPAVQVIGKVKGAAGALGELAA